jgi:hypothetical protein
MKQIKIVAEVTINVEDSTDIDNLVIDIYTHDQSTECHIQKVDHGADTWEITEYEEE